MDWEVALHALKRWLPPRQSVGCTVAFMLMAAPLRAAGLPFFDDRPNPVPVQNDPQPQDITPPVPVLEPFDRRVLALCGPGFDAPVDPAAFQQLLTDYPDVLQKLKAAAGGELQPGRGADAAFLIDLTAIWFEQNGFKHIFCGERNWDEQRQRYSIGGLHFHARYGQLQAAGLGERILSTTVGTREPAAAEVVPGVIYTFGVSIRDRAQLPIQHRIKGYGYTLNAQELLRYPTQAFRQFSLPAAAPRSAACQLTVRDRTVAPFPPETVTFQTVFVKRRTAIITFYPDATPDPQTPACHT